MPMILPPVPDLVDFSETRVLIADDVADTGATLALVKDFLDGKVAETRCAVLYEKPRSTVRCEYVWRRTDRWIDFPWSVRAPVSEGLLAKRLVPGAAISYSRRRTCRIADGTRKEQHEWEEIRARRARAGGGRRWRSACRVPGRRRMARRRSRWRVIYVGPHNDGGWSQAHDDGRAVRAEDARQQGADDLQGEHRRRARSSTRRCRACSNQGYKMIFATSYGMRRRSRSRRSTRRSCSSRRPGPTSAPNLSEYFGAAEDTVFLSGMAAGAASKNGNIGYVVAFPIPEVIRHANAFALGAQLTHPGAKVHLVWTNSWYDPAKEKKAAQSLVSPGRRRARPERRLAGDRPVRRVEGDPVGRVRLRRVEVRAEVVADRLGLQLGRRTT